MAVEIFDLLKIAHEEGKRKRIFNTERLHAWVHVYPKTGDKDDALPQRGSDVLRA